MDRHGPTHLCIELTAPACAAYITDVVTNSYIQKDSRPIAHIHDTRASESRCFARYTVSTGLRIYLVNSLVPARIGLVGRDGQAVVHVKVKFLHQPLQTNNTVILEINVCCIYIHVYTQTQNRKILEVLGQYEILQKQTDILVIRRKRYTSLFMKISSAAQFNTMFGSFYA